MNFTTFLSTLAYYIAKYDPQRMDNSMKPIDSAGSQSCRSMEFDFIIVGAGTAGCVVANRLSENPEWKVLLIEAGGDEGYETYVPALNALFNGTKYDWNYTTTKQENVCQGSGGCCQVRRGQVLGGSSSIGQMVVIRGNRADYDEWAELGNEGWSYQDVLPYFLKSENMTIPEFKNSPYHSTKGPLPISYASYTNDIVKTFREAATGLLGSEVDYNGEKQLGPSLAQLHLEGSQRWSTSRAYLDPIRNRKNLFIFKNTLVTKVIIDSNTNTAKGVCCLTNGEQFYVYSSKEVILSAGAINTPKLLMLSGVGPRDHLEELDIPVVADLPVGQCLVDQPGIIFRYSAKTVEIELNDTEVKEAIVDYAKNEGGILSAPEAQILGMFKFDNSSSTSIRADTLHIGGYIIGALTRTESFLVTYGCHLLPNSTGTIKLSSNNCKDQPLIDPNYFSSEYDVINVQTQINDIIKFIGSKVWEKYEAKLVTPAQCEFNGTVSEEFVRCYLKHADIVGQNFMSTAKMGPVTDCTSVVDSKLQVHGVKQLRVVDASVIPKPLSGTPFATEVMIAEKGSDVIKNSYQC